MFVGGGDGGGRWKGLKKLITGLKFKGNVTNGL